MNAHRSVETKNGNINNIACLMKHYNCGTFFFLSDKKATCSEAKKRIQSL